MKTKIIKRNTGFFTTDFMLSFVIAAVLCCIIALVSIIQTSNFNNVNNNEITVEENKTKEALLSEKITLNIKDDFKKDNDDEICLTAYSPVCSSAPEVSTRNFDISTQNYDYDEDPLFYYFELMSDVDPLSFYGNLPLYEKWGITEHEFDILRDVAWNEYGHGSAEGQAAVISIILNRVKSDKFPNDIESVVSQKGQFSMDYVTAPYHELTDSMLEGFEIAFSGIDLTNGGFYYCNLNLVDEATRKWFESLEVTADFGDHKFYR